MVKYLIDIDSVRAAGLVACMIAATMGGSKPAMADAAHWVDPTQSPMDAMQADAGSASSIPVLQSVKLSSGHQIATINGQSLRVGQKFADATLVRVNDHEAVLRNVDGSMQTLSMYPGIDKKVTTQPQHKAVVQHKTKHAAGAVSTQ
jgi:MSHA biogenesis protein MshK